MARNEEEFELVLGNKQILSIFFLVVVLFAVFFSFGYSVGYDRGQSEREQEIAAVEPFEEPGDGVQVPDALLKETPLVEEEPIPQPSKPKEAPPAKQAAEATSTAPPATEKPRPFRKTEPAREPAPPPKQTNTTTVSGTEVARAIHLQVAALRVRSDAQMLVGKLKDKGYPAVLYDQGGDGWHRVLIGPFRSTDTAQAYQKRLKGDGLESLLRKP